MLNVCTILSSGQQHPRIARLPIYDISEFEININELAPPWRAIICNLYYVMISFGAVKLYHVYFECCIVNLIGGGGDSCCKFILPLVCSTEGLAVGWDNKEVYKIMKIIMINSLILSKIFTV